VKRHTLTGAMALTRAALWVAGWSVAPGVLACIALVFVQSELEHRRQSCS